MTRIRVTTKTTLSQPKPEPERSLLERAADFIGNAAAYVAHEIMPDVRRELVEKAWTGTAEPTHPATTPAQAPEKTPGSEGRLETWLRTTTDLTIDDRGRRREPTHSQSLDIEH